MLPEGDRILTVGEYIDDSDVDLQIVVVEGQLVASLAATVAATAFQVFKPKKGVGRYYIQLWDSIVGEPFARVETQKREPLSVCISPDWARVLI